MSTAIVIVGASRTPMASFQGDFANTPAPELASIAIRSALARATVAPEHVDEVIMGCVLSAGLGQAPARQAALKAGLPLATGCTTINKMCGSGMKAVMLAHDLIRAGSADIMVAGGMENMSLAPYLVPKARQGLRMGHGQMLDHMFLDGLEDAYEGGVMGCFAQKTADKFAISREQMDDFALHSLQKAQQAQQQGYFDAEIAPVTLSTRQGDKRIDQDEQPGNAKPDKIRQLPPAFAKQGTITAANSSSISDGAAALVLMSERQAQQQGIRPLARIVAHATHAQRPDEFTLAPIGAIEKVLQMAGWHKDEVDLFEINEAFAVVTLLAQQQLALDPSKINVHGGACALGHPIGASGARVLVTLLYALQRMGKKRGLASLCIGGGEATAVAIERL